MKKIIAIIGIIILIGLYSATFILAILNIPGTVNLFKASVYATVMIPILIYIYLWLYKLMRDRNNSEE